MSEQDDGNAHKRLLRSLRTSVAASVCGAPDGTPDPEILLAATEQLTFELMALEELLEYREEGTTTATRAPLSHVIHGMLGRLDIARMLAEGMWDPDKPEETVLGDTKTLPLREGGAS